MTVGVEFGAKIMDIENKLIKLQIWDTAGQETFKSITRQYYRSAAGAILVYDVTRRDSFENVREWIKECRTHGSQDMVIVLVGNKVSRSEGETLAKENHLLFIETSAKDNLNVSEAFASAAQSVLRIVTKSQSKNELPGVRIGYAVKESDNTTENKKQSKCC